MLRSTWFQCDSIYFFDGIAEKGERERGEKTGSRAQQGREKSKRTKETGHLHIIPRSTNSFFFFFFFRKSWLRATCQLLLPFFFPFTLVTISPLRCTNRETDKRGRALFTFYLRSSLSTPPRFREDLSRFTIKLFHASEITLVTSCLFVLGSIVPCFLLYLSNISAFFQEKGEREKEHTLSSDFISRV